MPVYAKMQHFRGGKSIVRKPLGIPKSPWKLALFYAPFTGW